VARPSILLHPGQRVIGLLVGGAVLLGFLVVGAETRGPDSGREPSSSAVLASVPTGPVEVEVREVPIRTAPGPGRVDGSAGSGAGARAVSVAADEPYPGDAALTPPQVVEGFATVGVTWAPGQDVDPASLNVSVRSRQDGRWSAWELLPYEAEHGPDPEPGENFRDGTDPVAIGTVEAVQARVDVRTGVAPRGLRLSLVDPGTSASTERQPPALPGDSEGSATAAELVGARSRVTGQPAIFTRSQWGADETMRDHDFLQYGQVSGGIVHHTVNANDYRPEDVPSIIRGIYAYHTRSKGWSDIGYNFLVDRFGRIWEGRYGGVTRPVVGAHTVGYNGDTFAASAIGNYETARPSAAMLDSLARLFAWKLSLHGITADSPRQRVGDAFFAAISGHRDAGTTVCPGRYLYAKLPDLARSAAAYQAAFHSRQRHTALGRHRWPDIVVREATTGTAYVVHTGGQSGFRPPTPALGAVGAGDLVAAPGDVTGDAVADVVVRRSRTGTAEIYAGDGSGDFTVVGTSGRFADVDRLLGAGDLTGDGVRDVLGRRAGSTKMLLYAGRGTGGFRRGVPLRLPWDRYDAVVGGGDLDRDGADDLVARDLDGRLWLLPGDGRSGLGRPVRLGGEWSGYDLSPSMGDVTNDGRVDLMATRAEGRKIFVFPGGGKQGLEGTRLGPFRGVRGSTWTAVAGAVDARAGNDVLTQDPDGGLLLLAGNGRRNVDLIERLAVDLSKAEAVLNVGDWDRDGLGDLVVRLATGGPQLLRGTAVGGFADPVPLGGRWTGVRDLTAVGDLTGDGRPDLVGRPRGAALRVYPGDGARGVERGFPSHVDVRGEPMVGVGPWDVDGSPDVMSIVGGELRLWAGNGPSGLTGVTSLARRVPDNWLLGPGDLDGDRRADLVSRDGRGRLWLLPGTPSGGVGPRRLVATGFERFDLAG